MSLRDRIKPLWWASRIRSLRPLLIRLHEARSNGHDWDRPHPYDLANGIATHGTVPGFLITDDRPNAPSTAYVGAQPSIVRAAIAALPDPAQCGFIDLGCGKGRVLAVASEYPFRRIIGIELSTTLARQARANAAIIAARHPARTPIEVVNGDATRPELPDGDVVVFLYNSFGGALLETLRAHLEAALLVPGRNIYLASCNPAWGTVFDASPSFRRRFAAVIPYDQSELGFGPDKDDTVVIWQNRANPAALPPGDPDRPIKVLVPGWRATLV
jgi:SAM-dependent methyltransferase